MKRICIVLVSLFITGISFGQSITEVFVPQYIQGTGNGQVADEKRVPFACRVTINGLNGNTTYRYYNRFVNAIDTPQSRTSTGLGSYILVKPSGAFVRVTSASLIDPARYGTFTTDASGSYTGWFMNEVTQSNLMFFPGNTIYFRLYLNDGTTSSSVSKRLAAINSPIKVINFGTAADSLSGTAIRSTPAAAGTARNFVMLYDNTAGTGRPIAGTVIESDSVDNSIANGYASFYATDVNDVNKTWGTIIPNKLGNGIKKIVQYSLADGSKVGSKSASNGIWQELGGDTVTTVNPGGGLNSVIVIDGTAAPLSPAVDQTITFGALAAKTYGDGDFNPGATASSGLTVIYSSSDTSVAKIINDTTVHIVGAGFTEITAAQPGDDDYNTAIEKMQPLTVNKANLIIKADSLFWVQGTPMPALTLTYLGFVNGDDGTVLDPKPKVHTTATDTSSPGAYPITVDSAGSSNYTITYQAGALAIVSNKQPQTIDFSPLPGKVYGNTDFSPGAIASSGLSVKYTSSNTNVATITNGNMIHITGAGTTTITASQQGNNTYDPAPDTSHVLTVNKASLTITADNKTRLVGQDNPALTVAYSGFVNGENNTHLLAQPVVSTTATTSSAAGTYPIEVKDAASNNYEITYRNGELRVDPLPAQTINFPALPSKKYGDADFTPEARASSGLQVTYSSSNANVATIVKDTIIHIVGAGTAVITAKQPGDATHAAAPDVTQTLNVQKVSLTIRANDQSKNEGQPNPAFTVAYTGFVNGEDSSKLATLPQVTTLATTTSIAGTYRIAVQGATSPNYMINHQNGILTVLPPQGEGQDNMNAYISGPGQLQVNVYAVNSVKVAVQLFDLNGSRLINTSVTLNKGFNSYRIPIGNVSPGIYNVRVAGNGVMLKTKVVVQ